MFIKGTSGISAQLKLHTYKEGTLLPVLSSDELLFSSRHKGLIRKIRDLISIPSADFDARFMPVIARFTEFVQILPHKKNGILGSMLNHGLARATAVLEKYQSVKKEDTTPLLQFAILTAALMQELGRVVCNQRVVCVDKEGKFIQDWNPFSGPLMGQTEFYKMYLNANHYLRIEKESTLLIARQVMSRAMFLWLSNDTQLFADWIAALLNEEGAESNIISWALSLVRRDDILAILSSLEGTQISATESITTEHGEEFYRWLKEGINEGKFTLEGESALIHVVNEGVLLEKQLFKQFVDMTNVPVNYMVVFSQFGNLMGIAEKGGADFLHAQYFSGADQVARSSTFGVRAQKTKEGLVVSDSSLIFGNTQAPASSGQLKSANVKSPVSHHLPKSNSSLTLSQSKKQS